ncbi:hypothetical protein DdX_11661 [Ditylenchus destructor]|uniref:Uncharacterized protein n=1 Tax=Ditylenchus destructor TaxID=166010 RepID=A0AAD4R141_9BILA|nr:hypothetical protein DdX_11661 [Ditylenchus destructor]
MEMKFLKSCKDYDIKRELSLTVRYIDDILNIGGNLEKYSKEIYGNVLELNRTDKNNETAFLDLYIKSLALAEEYTVGFPITLVPISFKMNQNASDKLLHERNNLSEKQAKNNFGQNMEISDLNSKSCLKTPTSTTTGGYGFRKSGKSGIWPGHKSSVAARIWRVIRQSLRLDELSRLVPVSSPTSTTTGGYGFRKSGKSGIWPGHKSSVAARIWRVIRQSLRLDELSRLVPVSSPTSTTTGGYGFRKSGKSGIWPGHKSSVAARIWRVIRQSLRLDELSRLVPVSSPTSTTTGGYGFRKSGKSGIWPGHKSSVAARIWRVIRQSLRLDELSRLVPVSSPTSTTTGRYGFRKSGKSGIWPGHKSSVAARILACDTSIASSRRAESIGTGFKPDLDDHRKIWLPEIRKIRDLARSQILRRRSDLACDTSIASSLRAESIGTGFKPDLDDHRRIWLPEIRKIRDLARSQILRRRSDLACDTSIASSRRDKTIGTGLAAKICVFRDLWFPEIRKILEDQGRRQAAKPRGKSYGMFTLIGEIFRLFRFKLPNLARFDFGR